MTDTASRELLPDEERDVELEEAAEVADDEIELDDELLEDDDEDEEIDELELVVLDMSGTTVRDDGLVERAFELAAERTGLIEGEEALAPALEHLRDTMGRPRIEMFRVLARGDEAAARRANAEFERAYAELVSAEGVAEVPGAESVIRELQEAGFAVVLTTGSTPATRDAMLEALGWKGLADAVLSPSDAGRDRPYPDLPLTALLRARGTSVGQMVVVGDTASDIESGLNAGAGLVVGVLSGAHDEDVLEDAGADAIIDDITELPELLGLRGE